MMITSITFDHNGTGDAGEFVYSGTSPSPHSLTTLLLRHHHHGQDKIIRDSCDGAGQDVC